MRNRCMIAVAKCGFFLPNHARYSTLLNLPESEDIARAIEKAMEAIEEYKPELQGSLPKDEYYRLTRTGETRHLPFDLLRQFDNIPDDATGDVFGQIYEYFLGKFALSEGQGGGEFFTPRSVEDLDIQFPPSMQEDGCTQESVNSWRDLPQSTDWSPPVPRSVDTSGCKWPGLNVAIGRHGK